MPIIQLNMYQTRHIHFVARLSSLLQKLLGMSLWIHSKIHHVVKLILTFSLSQCIRFQGHGRASDNWAWAVLVYRLVTGKYPFYKDGIDELQLYKRICKGSLELDGLMSMEFRMLMVAVLYPDPRQRLGSARSGWRDLFASSWLSNDGTIDLGRLRKQGIPAPWTPDIQGDLDASSFHPDSSDLEDLMDRLFPEIADKQQQIFNNFGPQIFTF